LFLPILGPHINKKKYKKEKIQKIKKKLEENKKKY
jgi:hypothetical protein